MWIAKFVFCTMMEGCVAVTFDDQTDFATQDECELYTEEKSDLVKNTMEARGIVGAIYYDCEQIDGIKT
jgi:hypothetical protein